MGQQETTVAVDALSGDAGLDTALPAARQALEADGGLNLRLVLDEAGNGRLAEFGLKGHPRVKTVLAESTLAMDAGVARAIRSGQGSSMQIAIAQVASRQAGAVVSGGSTGALMALARQGLGMLAGIERPALMAALPSLKHSVWVLDLGANIDVNAQRLYEFAQLGSTAVRVLSGHPPRVGLLNIACEPGKGPDQVREAARLIETESAIALAGFIEADQVFSGEVDLVVCDGFAGNILLKSAEGMARLVFQRIEAGLAGWQNRLCRSVIDRVYDRLDPSRHNGAPLLGVDGIVIKSHGGASERGFAAAIALAALESRRNLIPELEEALWENC